ncbi:hypothetical protein QFC21_002029 [Naganishia friedmannii]|uniref:Uncharacterized protein n=1 Tax=Naganishia friedmannii TaxID=89922 RepID=A0ACC2VZB4_9TREE|nr:hypothetical protein QFC21_002029 [Naganishia friedmannii]
MSVPSMVVVDGRHIIAGRDLRTASNSSGVPAPSLMVPARYGLRKRSGEIGPETGGAVSSQSLANEDEEERPLSDYLVGTFLDDALGKDDANTISIHWPFEDSRAVQPKGKQKEVVDWRGREVILYVSLIPFREAPLIKLVLFGCRRHLFTYQFGQPPRENTTSLILVPPPTRSFVNSNVVLAHYTEIAFEALNCSTFSIMPWPVASLFGVGAMTGMVVHIGTYSTEIGVVVESTVRTDVGGCVNVGKEDCIAYLAELLSKDEDIRRQITENSNSITVESIFRELACGILDDEDRSKIMIPLASGQKAVVIGDDGEQEEEEGVLNVAKILASGDTKTIQQLKENKNKKGAAANAAALVAAEKAANDRAAQAAAEKASDVQTYHLASLNIDVKVGPVRHRACEPLYRALDGLGYGSSRTVQEGMTLVMKNLEPNYRQVVWESIVLTGDLARIPSLSYAITSHLNMFLLSNPDRETDEQPNHYRILKMPEYYPEFKNTSTNVAPFLGASIAAKAILNGHAISKTDYNQHGPAAIYLAAALE